MASTDHKDPLTSSEKKRVRDRRAQKNMREKRERRIQALERRVASCEQYHGAGWIQKLIATVDSLRKENERLVSRQEHLRREIMSWDDTDNVQIGVKPEVEKDHNPHSIVPSDSSHRQEIESPYFLPGSELATNSIFPQSTGDMFSSTMNSVAQPQQSSAEQYESHDLTMVLSSQPCHNYTSTTVPSTGYYGSLNVSLMPVPSPTQTVPGSVPAWSLVPLNEYGHNPSFLPASCSWLAYPDLIAACPPLPATADLLHGSRQNFLADKINRGLRRLNIRGPELLALGWLIYVYSKWRISPHPTTFARIPISLHPVMGQIQKGHPSGLDIIMWPRLRMNIIENWTRYNIAELVGSMCACTKVRWVGDDMVERDSKGVLQMKQEFFDFIRNESGWGLESEFINKYPELFDGMDLEAVRYR